MKNILLWVVSIIILLAAVVYQRTTGPTYPFRGSIEVNGQSYDYRLNRSGETTQPARIELPPMNADSFIATLHYKRFKTKDSLAVIPFSPDDGSVVALLPVQPAAGKIEYFVTIQTENTHIRIPESESEVIILRYKDPVPGWLLWPHVILMFFAILMGMRAGFSAWLEPDSMRRWTYIALSGMTLGGMVLGPLVQKYAFGVYWSGFPFGSDLTDNKMLVMWLVWVMATSVLAFKANKKDIYNRIAVGVASVIMTIAFLIPHSMQGSELDYNQVDQGIDPKEAIRTGK